MAMARLHRHLIDLPPEILALIACYVEKQDLLSLCRTCKRLSQHALNNMYSTIRLTGQKRSAPRSLLLFVRTVLQGPGVGNLIRHLCLDGMKASQDHDSSDHASSDPLTDVDIMLAQKRVCNLELYDPTAWLKGISERDPAAFLALVLTYTPRLQSLWLENRSFGRLNFLDDLLASAYTSHLSSPIRKPFELPANFCPDHLLHVRRLFLKPLLMSPLHKVLIFFYLPKLERAIVKLPGPDLNFRFPTFGPRLATLVELHLPFSGSPPSILADLLSEGPPLAILEYSFSADRVRGGSRVDVFSLSRAVTSISLTLENLILRVFLNDLLIDNRPELFPAGPFEGYLDGLHHCHRLTEVSLDLMMITDWRRTGSESIKLRTKLPMNVERLRLHDEGWGITGNDFEVADLLAGAKLWASDKQAGKFPNWTRLEVDYESSGNNLEDHELAALRAICSPVGLQASVGEFPQNHSEETRRQWIEDFF